MGPRGAPPEKKVCGGGEWADKQGRGAGRGKVDGREGRPKQKGWRGTTD